jgi:hypothetical protein
MVRLVAAVAAATLTATSAPAGDNVLFRLADRRLTEASGMGLGIQSPGIFYAQNDSGDSARFFALNGRTGQVVAQIRVAGATNVDWEDLAVARTPGAGSSVWLADIGDNAHNRTEVRLYRVAEPQLRPGPEHDLTVPVQQEWQLRYPGNARPNAESIAVSPAGQAYLFTKTITGVSAAYEVPSRPSGRVQTLRKIGFVRLRAGSGAQSAGGRFGSLLATGAALSHDGSRLVIRTYTDAYFWAVGRGGVRAALRQSPVRVALPPQPQGEGIAFDGGRVVLDSERVGSPVWSVPVPALPAPR